MTDLLHDAMMSEEDFLEHYGKKGMRWGVRKDSKNSTHVSADAARVRKIENRLKKNGPANLSNDDIAKLNKRAQLMSEYKKNNPSKLQKGHKATKEALSIIATATAVGVVGTKLAQSPTARKGAKIVVDIIKNMAASGAAGAANGGNYVQVFSELTR